MAENDASAGPVLPGDSGEPGRLTDLAAQAPQAEPVLDLRGERPDQAGLDRIDQYSLRWARVVGPISWGVLILLFLLMLIPFWMIGYFSAQVHISIPAGSKPEEVAAIVKAATAATTSQDVRDTLDWAKTVLPSLVGFGSAIIAYYFGIRTGSAGQGTPTSGNK